LSANCCKTILLAVAIIICAMLIPFPYSNAQATPRLVPTQPIYPIWRIGGLVTITASQLGLNATYYVWLQKPMEANGTYIGTRLLGTPGTASLTINVTQNDAPGTYRVSLSTSDKIDTRTAQAHFGVFGTDANTYKRTDRVHVAGGGATPNSAVSINITSSQGALSGFQPLATAGSNGDFNFTLRLSPSFPVGAVTIAVTGTTYDNRTQPLAISKAIDVTPAVVSLNLTAQPSSSVERTDNAIMTFQLQYQDGSPVTTASPNSTLVTVIRNDDQQVITRVPFRLFEPGTGIWRATWVPQPYADLTTYHFYYTPSLFNDSYGNLAQETAIVSSNFTVIPANVVLSIQTNAVNSTLQRTQTVQVTIVPKYHDGSNFMNVTQMAGNITDADGVNHVLSFGNKTLGPFLSSLKVPINATLGTWKISSATADIYGNKGAGELTIQIVKADIKYTVNLPAKIERAAIYNMTVRVTYPDGSILGPDLLSPGYEFNMTISLGNLTIRHPLAFNATKGLWAANYEFAQNATLAAYAVDSNVTDIYANAGVYSATTQVIQATFRFIVAQPLIKVEPSVQVPIIVSVDYPNGSALIPFPEVNGTVSASLTNSSGTYTLPMVYNSTAGIWYLIYIAPNPGLSFGTTVNFGFQARDSWGNAGLVAKAIEVDIGAPIQALILTTIIAGIVPASLLGWAIVTVAGRRRKHKP
jgi:hypothetical protein